jgi:hypothetical protein
MGLQSRFFRGDPKLEAAAVSDPAHVMLGASGPHVQKIQTALMLLDGASISADEVQRTFYGTSTAAAVLAYKQKRNIINRSYQTQADNIVGKMTMASLDSEMLKREIVPHAPVRIIPLSWGRLRPPRSHALVASLHRSRPLELNVRGSKAIAALHFVPGPVMVMPRNSTGSFQVVDGADGEISTFDDDIITFQPDDFVGPLPRGAIKFSVKKNPQTFNVRSLGKLDEAQVTVTTPTDLATLIIVVNKPFPSPPPFHENKPHNHAPCLQWPKIQADPQSSGPANFLCSGAATPEDVINSVKLIGFAKAPLALQHLDRYLSGTGNDFVEDDNIRHWLHQDSNIRNRLKNEIFPPGKKRKNEGHFEFGNDQKKHIPFNEFDTTKTADFKLSFGSIDRVDFAVDFSDDTVRVWFKDRYEFHPVFRGLYNFVDGDFVRADNCIHAAAVEMKAHGAADFWMIGEAVVPLGLIAGP